MKRFPMLFPLALALVVSVVTVGCSDADPVSAVDMSADAQSLAKDGSVRSEQTDVAAGTIGTEEREDLVFMREEEKVARDIYIMMYKRWGVRVFDNIAHSEETHMTAILRLLDRYAISDPVGTNAVGVFSDQHLQEMYDALLARGNTSRDEAYKVGVLIEETDIADLKKAISRTDNRDIVRVYTNLLNGSLNHLSAFSRVLATD